MRVRYLDWKEGVRSLVDRFKVLERIFAFLLVREDGDVERALEILEQANFRLFDLAGPRRSPLREVSGAFMQSRYSRHHGDLFVVKRGPGLTALTSQAGIKVVSPAPADTTASERKESAQ